MNSGEEDVFLGGELTTLWGEHGVEISMPRAQRKAAPRRARAKPAALRPAAGKASTVALPDTLEKARQWLGDCRRCRLCEGRNQIVFGDGDPKARLVFVGEGPGADEDASGLPFVGRAGKLLDKIIEAMGLQRRQVYIANIVKCRPPGNRTPTPDEVEACAPFLKAQLAILRPRIIVALGATAATNLTGTVSAMSGLRSRFHPLKWDPEIPVMPTYHPAYLLRNPDAKRLVWDDMKKVMARLGGPG